LGIAIDAFMSHNNIMRTTVNIADYLLIEAKRLAATRRISLAKVIEDSLRKYLAEYRAGGLRARDARKIPLLDGGEPVAGVDLDDTSELMER
jgi:hypothetical protein